MAEKLRLSAESTEILDRLYNNLNVRKNALCRIALSISLMHDGEVDFEDNSLGQEFNRSTVMGNDEFIFLSMIACKEGTNINYNESFNTVVRYNVIRGLYLMDRIYKKLNSPTEFFNKLLDYPLYSDAFYIDSSSK